jgi:hypothetical protein
VVSLCLIADDVDETNGANATAEFSDTEKEAIDAKQI